jgi:hypothetical protein
MSNENKANSMSDPQPMNARNGRRILRRLSTIVGVSVGSVVAFVVLVSPTAVRGGSRSARLKWQQRLKQMQRAIAAIRSNETLAPARGAETQAPSPPPH